MELDMIYNEDCLIGMDRIPDMSIDMILCDLPYGTTRNKWDSVIPLDRLWEQYKRVIKKGGAIVLTCQIPFMINVANSNREWLRYEWVWVKHNSTGFLNANRMPMKVHENILVFYDSLGKYNPQGAVHSKKKTPCGTMSDIYDTNSDYAKKKIQMRSANDSSKMTSNYNDSPRGYYFDLTNYPTDVLKFKNDIIAHPTAKPVALFEYLIRTYTDEGEIVLDNCMGSGTTAVACIRSGRHFIGFETDEGYCKMANERISQTKRVYENNLERFL